MNGSSTPPPPKVTVCVVTYNQEEYVAQCLQSIVEQKTDFEFDVLVSDDYSTDNTRKIIKEFASTYDFIKLILRSENIGALANFVDTHQRATGCYISHIDGDDFMYKHKLQKQSDILDNMPSVAIVAHPVKVVGSSQIIGSSDNYPEIGGVHELLTLGMYFTNGSTMYRLKDRFNYKNSGPTVDFYRFIELSSCGDIFLLKDILGEYRVHAEGISKNSKYFRQINDEYERAYDRAIELGTSKDKVEKARSKRQVRVAISFLLASDFKNFRKEISVKNKSDFLNLNHHILNSIKNNTLLLKVIVSLHKLRKL